MRINFAKYDGAGNDFVMVDDLAGSIELDAETVTRICDRHFGVGADGVIVARQSPREECLAFMDYWNSDGTKAEMCGNGVRCFAKFLDDSGLTGGADSLVADTPAGPKPLDLVRGGSGAVESVRVDMGEPVLDPTRVPTTLAANHKSGAAAEVPITMRGKAYFFTCISMGNPHAIAFVDEDVAKLPLETIGPLYESHEVFPARANIEFAHVEGDDIWMRVWERGCGETLACGTGSCATAVAAHITGRAGRRVNVHVLGGTLEIEWAEDNHVLMCGPASRNWEGVLDTDEICAS